jgi:hypothetical protein
MRSRQCNLKLALRRTVDSQAASNAAQHSTGITMPADNSEGKRSGTKPKRIGLTRPKNGVETLHCEQLRHRVVS